MLLWRVNLVQRHSVSSSTPRLARRWYRGVRHAAPRPAVHRGAVRFEGHRRLRFEVTSPPLGVEAHSAADWGLIWSHGLTSSMQSEEEGGWPFAWVRGLADILPVTRWDARGHGTSDDSEVGHTWPLIGGDVARLHNYWGRRRIVLGGTSMGAAASLYAVLDSGVDAAGMILCTPPTCHGSREKFVPMYRESIEYTRSFGMEASHQLAASKSRPPIFMESDFGKAMFEIGWKCKFEMGQERYCAAMEGACSSDLPPPEVLSHICVPTLILAWRSDVQHPVETANMLYEILPNAELFVASSWAEVEEEFPRRMRSFLQRLMNRQ